MNVAYVALVACLLVSPAVASVVEVPVTYTVDATDYGGFCGPTCGTGDNCTFATDCASFVYLGTCL